MFSFFWKPCTPKKFIPHIKLGKKFLSAPDSALVELLVFSFCFKDFFTTEPHPKDMAPPMWLFMSLCTENDESTQVFMIIMSSARKVNFFPMCHTGIAVPVLIFSNNHWYCRTPWYTKMQQVTEHMGAHICKCRKALKQYCEKSWHRFL